jgi:hypothetical protein
MEPLIKSHMAAASAFRDGMREAARSEWSTPFASGATKQATRGMRRRVGRGARNAGSASKGAWRGRRQYGAFASCSAVASPRAGPLLLAPQSPPPRRGSGSGGDARRPQRAPYIPRRGRIPASGAPAPPSAGVQHLSIFRVNAAHGGLDQRFQFLDKKPPLPGVLSIQTCQRMLTCRRQAGARKRSGL